MTPIEIIFAIREKLKEYVDDTRYTNRYLLKLVDLKRAVLIRQQYNQIQRSVDNQLEQLFVVPTQEVDTSDSISNPTEEEYLLRSVKPLPKVIELHHRNLISRIATLGKMDKPINQVSMRRFIYIGQDEFEADAIYATIDELGYLYIKSNNGEELNYEFLSVRGIWESPLELFNPDSLHITNYPLNTHMVDVVINMIVQELANLKSLPSDIRNSSADDATILKGNPSE